MSIYTSHGGRAGRCPPRICVVDVGSKGCRDGELSAMPTYAELGISRLMPTAGLCRVGGVSAGEAGERGRARGIIRVVVGGSEVVEEGQYGVRGSVASGRCAGPGEAVEGLLLEGEVG